MSETPIAQKKKVFGRIEFPIDPSENWSRLAFAFCRVTRKDKFFKGKITLIRRDVHSRAVSEYRLSDVPFRAYQDSIVIDASEGIPGAMDDGVSMPILSDHFEVRSLGKFLELDVSPSGRDSELEVVWDFEICDTEGVSDASNPSVQ